MRGGLILLPVSNNLNYEITSRVKILLKQRHQITKTQNSTKKD